MSEKQAQNGIIAFFTPEIAIDQSLHTYSGGLGVFSGGMLMSARKLGVPMVGVSLLTTQGYYDQYIDGNKMGWRLVSRHYGSVLKDTGVIFSVEVHGTPVWVRVLLLSESAYGASRVYFLNTDIEENDWLSRSNSFQLYPARAAGANLERHITQSIIVGKAGIEALRRLEPAVSLFHLNESHMAFVAVEIFLEYARRGVPYDEAMRKTRERVVFTTHTPVKAGNPEYDLGLVSRLYFNGSGTAEGKMLLERIGGSPFNMAAAALRLSRKANAVSQRHWERVQKEWAWLGDDLPPLIGITNGVSREFWQKEEFRDAETADAIGRAKMLHKKKLARVISEGSFFGTELGTAGRVFSPDIFTLVWARRFAAYKRPKLLLRGENFEWLKELLSRNELQVIYAGKPHPDDEFRIGDWNDLLTLSRELPNFYVLPGYELAMNELLKAAADLWLNTPRAPDEACGTSGMSAAMNGAWNMSTPDGWELEQNPDNCSLFGTPYPVASEEQDSYDAEKLREYLPRLIRQHDLDPRGWNEKILAAKREVEVRFSSDRMVEEYREKLYMD